MMNLSRAAKITFEVRNTSFDDTKTKVLGWVIGDWGIYKSDINWRVVHVPSGLYTYAFGYPCKRNAFACARVLSSILNGYDPSVAGNLTIDLKIQVKDKIRYWGSVNTARKDYNKYGIPKGGK